MPLTVPLDLFLACLITFFVVSVMHPIKSTRFDTRNMLVKLLMRLFRLFELNGMKHQITINAMRKNYRSGSRDVDVVSQSLFVWLDEIFSNLTIDFPNLFDTHLINQLCMNYVGEKKGIPLVISPLTADKPKCDSHNLFWKHSNAPGTVCRVFTPNGPLIGLLKHCRSPQGCTRYLNRTVCNSVPVWDFEQYKIPGTSDYFIVLSTVVFTMDMIDAMLVEFLEGNSFVTIASMYNKKHWNKARLLESSHDLGDLTLRGWTQFSLRLLKDHVRRAFYFYTLVKFWANHNRCIDYGLLDDDTIRPKRLRIDFLIEQALYVVRSFYNAQLSFRLFHQCTSEPG